MSNNKPEIQTEYENEDGWSDWIAPISSGYLLQCCDCGLIHEMEFKIGDSDDGRKDVPVFRAKRLDKQEEQHD